MSPSERGPDVTRVSTYEEVERRLSAARQLFFRMGLSLHRNSDLATLLRHAEEEINAFAGGRNAQRPAGPVLVAEADRVAAAILQVGEEPNARECLSRMSSGQISNSVRGPSPGKDALWEIELTAYLRSKEIIAELAEPDVVIEIAGERYPLACKKVHSERGVETQFRKGVHQLERFGAPGLIAFSIDQLTPPGTVFLGRDTRSAGDELARINRNFIDRHRRHFESRVIRGRCHGVLVMVNVVADLEQASPRLNGYSQTTIWTMGGKHQPTSRAFLELVEALSTR